jgi:hypothetical protein
MKLTHFFMMSFFGLSFAYASDYEMPEELKRLGYNTVYIPSELGRKLDSCVTLKQKIEYFRTHPILSYDLSDGHVDKMESQFEAAEKFENERQSWSVWFGIEKVKTKEKQTQLLKTYLDLAEEGYAWANYRLSEAFRRGELGLRVNLYWAEVFADRPCDSLSMDDSRKSFEAALRRLEAECRGETKEGESLDEEDYIGDQATQQYRKNSNESLSDDTASTLRVSDEIEANEVETLPMHTDMYYEQPQQQQNSDTNLRHRNIKKYKEEKIIK